MLFWILSLAICLALAVWAHKAKKPVWAILACFAGLLTYAFYPVIVDVDGLSGGLWAYIARTSLPVLFIFPFACVFSAAMAEMFDWTASAEGAKREIQVAFAPRKK